MTIKGFFKQNPLRFVVIMVVLISFYALMIVNSLVVIIETTAIQQGNFRTFMFMVLASFVFILIDYLLQGLLRYLQSKQEEQYKAVIRQKTIDHFYKDQKEHPVAQVQNGLTNDLVQSQENYLEPFFNLLGGVAIIVSVVALLISLHWSLLLAVTLMVIISLTVPKLLEKPLQQAITHISESNQKYLDCLDKWLSGLEEIQRYFAGEKLFAITDKAAKDLEDANVKQNGVMQLLSIVNGLISVCFQTILFLLAGYLFQQKLVAFGVVVGVGNCQYYLRMGVEEIVNSYGQMKGAQALNKKIAEETKSVEQPKLEQVSAPAELSVRDLSLQFPNGESLKFPDIDIKAGEKILLTGDSGAGKSTLFKLILEQLKPTTGKIVFKNKNGAPINPDMEKIGYIPQDPVLFPASIADNMTMFADKLKSALPSLVEKVQLDGDIAKFDQGLNQQIDLNKLNISGGQRQKIVLVRALVHHSELILIDEGTSAIDQQATMEILREVTATSATVIFIAHNFNEQMKQLFDREIHIVKNTTK